MTALAASGDAAAALQLAQAYRALVLEQLDAPPDPTVGELAAEIRRKAEARAPPRPGGGPSQAISGSVQPEVPLPAPAGTHRRLLIPGVTAAAVVVVGLGWVLARKSETPPTTRPVLAVAPFEYHGEASSGYLGPGLTELVKQGIRSAGGIRLIELPNDSAGQVNVAGAPLPAGASHFLSGRVVEQGGRLQVILTLTGSAQHGAVPQTTQVDGLAVEPFELAHRLANEVIALVSPGVSPRITRTAGIATSLDAFRAFVQGEEEFRQRRFPAAIEAFELATRIDTAFAVVGSSRVDLQACKLEYSIVSPK